MDNLYRALLREDFDRLRRDLELLRNLIPKGGAKRRVLHIQAKDLCRDLHTFKERWFSANEQPKSE